MILIFILVLSVIFNVILIYKLIRRKKDTYEIQATFNGGITSSDLIEILNNKFPNIMIGISDSKYKLCSKDNIEDFLKVDQTNNFSYIEDYRDCDDYAFILLGEIKKSSFGPIPFGFAWVDTNSGFHAVNIFLDEERDLYVVEPQDDSIFDLPENWKPYLIVI